MREVMKNIFPEPIKQFPKADIPLEGLTAYLSQADTHQTLYMQFDKTVELPEHEHADQIGFILEGKIEIVFGPHHRVSIFDDENGNLVIELIYTHHGVRFKVADNIPTEFEKAIYSLRDKFPENVVD